MSPISASFELERFALTPVSEDTVLLEIGGVLLDVPPRSGPPRLLMEGGRRARREHNALESEVDGERLRVSFVVPAGDAKTAGFALAVGGLLLELPAPGPTPGADRTVALARELNGARRELTRLRARIAADAEAAGVHAAELAAVREEATEREQEAVAAAEARAEAAEQSAEDRASAGQQDVEARVAAAQQDAADRVEAAEAAAEERAGAAEVRATELEVAAGELETVLADVRAGAEQRDAAAATERRDLEAELATARGEAVAASDDAAEAARREDESSSELARLRSELELAQRALDGRDAELARSPDRRARAVARPRTVAGVTGEHPAVEPGEPEEASSLAGSEALTAVEPSGDAAGDVGEFGSDEAEPAQAADGGHPDPDDDEVDPAPAADDRDLVPDDDDTQPVLAADDGDPVPDDGDTEPVLAADDGDPVLDDDDTEPVLTADDGDPVPDDGEADSTMTHDAAPARRPDPEPPEDTGPIPLRRGSQRRYSPLSDGDEEPGTDATRVLGRERPRASVLPPAPDDGPGLPAGLTPRTVAIGVIALAAFLVLVAILGYVF